MPRPARAPTLPLRLYRGATTLIAPLVWAVVSRKLRRHGVPAERMHERLGVATQPRPVGPLVWFHAASVGESLSVLALIAAMAARLPQTSFLITSGTATSAELIGKRLPPRTRHQFAPLDAAGPVGRFYAHWRPDAGIFVESELWPLMLVRGAERGMPLALLNARLSEKSVRGWRRVPQTAQAVLDSFTVMITQNRKSADDLLAIGADPDRVRSGVNLKSTSAPLPVDPETLAALEAALDGRPVWVASSTHPGEEPVVLAAHKVLLEEIPTLCLLLVPRHPDRGGEVAALIAGAGLTSARRSQAQPVTADTQVYLADTLGETGTWYALSRVVFLGGSLLPIGGHNPFEPALAGAAVLTGPHVANFAETFAPLLACGAAVEVADTDELAQAARLWLREPARLEAAASAAADFVADRQSALAEIVDTLCSELALEPRDA